MNAKREDYHSTLTHMVSTIRLHIMNQVLNEHLTQVDQIYSRKWEDLAVASRDKAEIDRTKLSRDRICGEVSWRPHSRYSSRVDGDLRQ